MATKGGRRTTYVNRHIKHLAADDTDKFGLGVGRFLEVETAHHAVARAGLVVLNERVGEVQSVGIALVVVAFEKVAPRVAEYLWLDDYNTFYICLVYSHIMVDAKDFQPAKIVISTQSTDTKDIASGIIISTI